MSIFRTWSWIFERIRKNNKNCEKFGRDIDERNILVRILSCHHDWQLYIWVVMQLIMFNSWLSQCRYVNIRSNKDCGFVLILVRERNVSCPWNNIISHTNVYTILFKSIIIVSYSENLFWRHVKIGNTWMCRAKCGLSLKINHCFPKDVIMWRHQKINAS